MLPTTKTGRQLSDFKSQKSCVRLSRGSCRWICVGVGLVTLPRVGSPFTRKGEKKHKTQSDAIEKRKLLGH